MKPTSEPVFDGKTPDLSVYIGGTTFNAEVFVTNRPKNTIIDRGDEQGYEDSDQAAKKIADSVQKKVTKYRDLHDPLIVFVMFGGYDVDWDCLETALYGSVVSDIRDKGMSTDECYHPGW